MVIVYVFLCICFQNVKCCVTDESEYTSHFVKCERSVVSLNPGKSDEVTCTATFGRGNLNPFYISAKLSKKVSPHFSSFVVNFGFDGSRRQIRLAA